MLILGPHFRAQKRTALACLVLGLAAAGWYGWASYRAARLLGGGSFPGFSFGVAGGLICLFECLLYARKHWFRGWRLGRLEAWMRWHIWLGLLSVPILLMHAGPNWGGSLSLATMLVFLTVILSGVAGLALQNVIPQRMLAEVQAETIYSQIDLVIGRFREEAERIVASTCGRTEREAEDDAGEEVEETSHHLVVGRRRTAGKISGTALQTQSALPQVPRSEPLRAFFQNDVEPFLRPDGLATTPKFRRVDQSKLLFDDLRTKLDPRAFPAVAMIEDLCEQRRQLDRQRRLHLGLHAWLLVHVPLSAALLVLMFAHAIAAWIYK